MACEAFNFLLKRWIKEERPRRKCEPVCFLSVQMKKQEKRRRGTQANQGA